MKRQRTVLAVLIMIMVLCMANIACAAASSSISSSVSYYKSLGYTCTKIYNEGKRDEGFAAFRAVKTGKFLYYVATGQGVSESASNEYAARPAYGYAQYTHGYIGTTVVGTVTSWHTSEACWTDLYGCLQTSVKTVKVRGKLVTDDAKYKSLTDYVTDTP